MLLVLLALFLLPYSAQAATIAAADCNRDTVNTALTSASDGDTITIADGSCTWTTGIDVTKQVTIRALNMTSTTGGRSTQSVVITNNSATVPLFKLTSGNSYHVGLAGIRFNEGTSTINHLRVTGTGTKVPRVWDCYFETYNRSGNQDNAAIYWLSNGGILWDSYLRGLSSVETVSGSAFIVESQIGWTTASTMGTADTDGSSNMYIEDSTFYNFNLVVDAEKNARVVIRHNTYDGSWGEHHGLTTNPGARHSEVYDNTFTISMNLRNLARQYYWIRGGTAVITGNVADNAPDPGSYGAPDLLRIGEDSDSYDNTYPPDGTPEVYMPGWGHNGAAFVSDPIYMWSNTGARGETYRWTSTFWENFVQLNRDFYLSAKSGWTRYTYPHPLRSGESTPSSTATHRGISIGGGVSIR